MHRLQWARALVVAAIVVDVAVLFGGAALKPGYSQATHFISELNATGTPWAREIGWLGFLPLGLLIAAFLWVAAPLARVRGASRVGYWLLLSQPLAYIGAVLAPCDPGCPVQGSVSQQLHNLLGALTYPAAGIGFLLLATAPALARWVRVALATAGVVWLGLFAFMLDPALADVRGLLQRLAEANLFLVLALIAWRMLADPHASR